MAEGSKMIVSTRNRHKLEEIGQVLKEWQVSGLDSLPEVPEVEETGRTFVENASLKALAASKFTSEMVLADDSGLEVDALGGGPGVDSAIYAGTHGDDAANNAKLLQELEGVEQSERGGRFVCVLVLAREGKVLGNFRGEVEGHLAQECLGNEGFGYDPLFIPVGYEQTFGELGSEVKNGLSHRARALKKLREFLEEDGIL